MQTIHDSSKDGNAHRNAYQSISVMTPSIKVIAGTVAITALSVASYQAAQETLRAQLENRSYECAAFGSGCDPTIGLTRAWATAAMKILLATAYVAGKAVVESTHIKETSLYLAVTSVCTNSTALSATYGFIGGATIKLACNMLQFDSCCRTAKRRRVYVEYDQEDASASLDGSTLLQKQIELNEYTHELMEESRLIAIQLLIELFRVIERKTEAQ